MKTLTRCNGERTTSTSSLSFLEEIEPHCGNVSGIDYYVLWDSTPASQHGLPDGGLSTGHSTVFMKPGSFGWYNQGMTYM